MLPPPPTPDRTEAGIQVGAWSSEHLCVGAVVLEAPVNLEGEEGG